MTIARGELELGVLASVDSPRPSLASAIFQVPQLGFGEHLHTNSIVQLVSMHSGQIKSVYGGPLSIELPHLQPLIVECRQYYDQCVDT